MSQTTASEGLVELDYFPSLDLLTGRMGKPALAHLVPLRPGLVIAFDRQDPSEIVGMEFQEFSKTLRELDREWLIGLLGAAVVSQLETVLGDPSVNEVGNREPISIRIEAQASPDATTRMNRLSAFKEWVESERRPVASERFFSTVRRFLARDHQLTSRHRWQGGESAEGYAWQLLPATTHSAEEWKELDEWKDSLLDQFFESPEEGNDVTVVLAHRHGVLWAVGYVRPAVSQQITLYCRFNRDAHSDIEPLIGYWKNRATVRSVAVSSGGFFSVPLARAGSKPRSSQLLEQMKVTLEQSS